MADVTLWVKVAIAVESSRGASQDVTAISKAATGVVTYAGADPTNGDYVLINSQGMVEVDSRVFRVANVNAGGNTLELEGENTTNYGTHVAGSMYPLVLGTTLATVVNLTASGGDFNFIDVTTIHDEVQKQIPGVASAAVYTMEMMWDPADAGFVALKAAADLKAQKAIRITFSNNKRVAFVGYIGASGLPVGNAQDKVTTPAAITMFGRPTMYAT